MTWQLGDNLDENMTAAQHAGIPQADWNYQQQGDDRAPISWQPGNLAIPTMNINQTILVKPSQNAQQDAKQSQGKIGSRWQTIGNGQPHAWSRAKKEQGDEIRSDGCG